MLYSFDEYVLDTHRFELRNGDEVVTVEPKVFNLIAHFVAHPGEVFSTDDLVESIWDGRVVSDSTIASCVKHARKAINDTDPKHRRLETVRGRGFRFNSKISTTDTAALPTSKSSASSPSVASNVELTIILLPFRCLSDDAQIQHTVAGIGSELGGILHRVPLLTQSVEAGRYQSRDLAPTAREIHEELGVDFVLNGTSQPLGSSIRTHVQLANARTGMQIWSETFNHDVEDPHWQSRCVHEIVGRLEPQLHRAMHRVMVANSRGKTAQQLFLEANGLLISNGWNHVAYPQAQALLRQSCQLDPEFALAPSLHSMLLGFGHKIGLLSNTDELKQEAMTLAETALSLDNMDSTVLGLTGCSIADIGFPERGESLLRNAIDMNSTNAQAWVALGSVRLLYRDTTDALVKLSHGIDISPMDSRLSIWGALYAVALLHAGDAPEACIAAEAACQRHDNTYPARVVLAGARMATGDYACAKAAITEARRIKSDLNDLQISSLVGKELHAALVQLSTAT